jgi:hypothetical protein
VLTRARTTNGTVEFGPRTVIRLPSADGATKDQPELVVLASGCVGLVYFALQPGRLTLEEIEELYPTLIPTLRDHPGVGFMLVHSKDRGAVVIGRAGVRYLERDSVEGIDPLAVFGPNAASHVKRTDGFEHAADIMVNSAYDPATEEVYAFEELVGSHGGLGGPQSFPFIVLPAAWAIPPEEIVGAEAVHRWMRRWLADLGHERYLEENSQQDPRRLY